MSRFGLGSRLGLFASVSLLVSCARILGIDPGHRDEVGGSSPTSSISTGNAGGAGGTTVSVGTGSTGSGAGCAPPSLSYLQQGDFRFVAADLTPEIIAAGWKDRTPDETLLVSSPEPPILVDNAFNGCHQGVEVGYVSSAHRWLHSANPAVPLTDRAHTFVAVVRVVTFDALSGGLPQDPGLIFLSGVQGVNMNSALGFDLVDSAHAFAWNGGYGETYYDGSTQLKTGTVYVLTKVTDSSGAIKGYVDSVFNTLPIMGDYTLNDDIGIGGVAFDSGQVLFGNGLDSILAEAIVMHRAASLAEVKTLSCDLATAYGAGPLNCL